MPDFEMAIAKLWPHGDDKISGLRAGIVATTPAVFAKYGITTPLLVSHVMAQISHECGAGHEVVENLNYSAGRMMQVWPGRFPTMGAAAPYAHNGRALANKVYGGRMGNSAANDDGWNYRGRGASQTTGREGYTKLAKLTGLELLANPDLVNDPRHFLECGVADFILCGCLPYAQRDDIVGVTHHLNGGLTGLQERRLWLAKWKAILTSVTYDRSVAPTPPPPVVASPPLQPQLPSQMGPSITNPAPGSVGAKVASWWSGLLNRKV